MNKRLLLYLAENYNGAPPASEAPCISSHWQQCLERLKIKTDDEGKIIFLAARDTGLDTFERRGFLDALTEFLNMAIHWLRLPRKKELLKLSAKALSVCRAMKRPFNFDVFRQLYCLAVIKENFGVQGAPELCRNVLMVGDGYGILSAVFKEVFPESRLVLVDLGKTLLLQAAYCQLAHPGKKHRLFNEVDASSSDFVYCPAEFLEKLEGLRFDLAVNIVSMHEMNAGSIRRYFDFFRKNMNERNLFYCCNREYKQLKGGEKTLFSDYPWHPEDKIFFDEPCPWHQVFLSRRSGRSPGLGGFRFLPRLNYYHSESKGYGRIRHRLCVLGVETP